MNQQTHGPAANLYAHLVELEARRHRDALDQIHQQRHALRHAEACAARLCRMGIQTEARVDAALRVPRLVVQVPIELLHAAPYLIQHVAHVLQRRVIENLGRSGYLVLPTEQDDYSGLSLEVEGI